MIQNLYLFDLSKQLGDQQRMDFLLNYTALVILTMNGIEIFQENNLP